MTDAERAAAIYVLLGRIGELATEGIGMDAEEVAAQARLLAIMAPQTALSERVYVMATDSRLPLADQRTMRQAALALHAIRVAELAREGRWREIQRLVADALKWDTPEWLGDDDRSLLARINLIIMCDLDIPPWQRETAREASRALGTWMLESERPRQ